MRRTGNAAPFESDFPIGSPGQLAKPGIRLLHKYRRLGADLTLEGRIFKSAGAVAEILTVRVL